MWEPLLALSAINIRGSRSSFRYKLRVVAKKTGLTVCSMIDCETEFSWKKFLAWIYPNPLRHKGTKSPATVGGNIL
jgi:hypothetical protein